MPYQIGNEHHRGDQVQQPSHGPFACRLKPAEVAAVYRDNGAAAISVLTEEPRFQGKLEYLRQSSEN